MSTTKPFIKAHGRIGAGVLAGMLMLASASAFAGECPADQVGTDVTKPGATSPKDVTDNVIGMIDLSKDKLALGRHFRLRRLEVQPGGEVPWHAHDDRPAIIYIISGSITEYRSTCAVPIEHKAGEVAVESGSLAHWWKNNGSEPVVLLSSDLFSDPNDSTM